MGLSSTSSELGGPSTSAARSDRIGQCAQPGGNSWAHWPWPVVMDGVTAPARGQAIPVESLRSSEEPTSTEGSRLPASVPDRSRCGLRPISTRGSRKPSLPPHTPGTDHLVAPRSLQKETDGLGVILVAVDQGEGDSSEPPEGAAVTCEGASAGEGAPAGGGRRGIDGRREPPPSSAAVACRTEGSRQCPCAHQSAARAARCPQPPDDDAV